MYNPRLFINAADSLADCCLRYYSHRLRLQALPEAAILLNGNPSALCRIGNGYSRRHAPLVQPGADSAVVKESDMPDILSRCKRLLLMQL